MIKTIIFLGFITTSICYIVQPVKRRVKQPPQKIIIFGNSKCSGKLQDAGDYEKPKLDTAIIRKMKSIKWESDKYNVW